MYRFSGREAFASHFDTHLCGFYQLFVIPVAINYGKNFMVCINKDN